MYWARHWTNYSGKKNKVKQTAHHAHMSFGCRPVKETLIATGGGQGQTGFATEYALCRRGACRPASSASRPRIQSLSSLQSEGYRGQTGFAMEYALCRRGACCPASSTSRPRILSLFPTRLLRATFTVVVGTCGTMLLRTDSSGANPCLSYLSDHIRYQRFGIIQHQSPECHNSISCQLNYIFLSPQTAFFAPVPFEPPACERGHDTDYGKAGGGIGKSLPPVLAQRSRHFPMT